MLATNMFASQGHRTSRDLRNSALPIIMFDGVHAPPQQTHATPTSCCLPGHARLSNGIHDVTGKVAKWPPQWDALSNLILEDTSFSDYSPPSSVAIMED